MKYLVNIVEELAVSTCEEVGSLLVFPLHELVESLCLVGGPLLGELALTRTENKDAKHSKPTNQTSRKTFRSRNVWCRGCTWGRATCPA